MHGNVSTMTPGSVVRSLIATVCTPVLLVGRLRMPVLTPI